jgi:hypothetical protein
MKALRPPRCDSYEVQLTPDERAQLHEWLLDPTLSLVEIVKRTPAWHGGKLVNKKPDAKTLSKIRIRLQCESFLITLEANALVSDAVETEIRRRYKGKGDIQERLLDRCMTVMSEEVLEKTIKKLDPQGRTAAARLLLVRSEQKIQREKLALETKKTEQALEKTGSVTKDALARAAEELKLL